MNKDIIAWWSGGVTSAVTCKLCIGFYGLENVRFIFIDTKNEDDDTYRFLNDCEKWYGKKIETITGIGEGHKYKTINDIWYKHKSLNVATGAICSTISKRKVREVWEKTNDYRHQAFGFEWSEFKRAKSMKMNNPKTKPIFPLLMEGLSKVDCINIIQNADIRLPEMYQKGFHNNNCFKTGCVQGGIGYWQKIKNEYPDKFNAMAKVEHELTEQKGEPVTMLKDQRAKSINNKLVFLKPHKDYPNVKHIGLLKGREVKPLFECNGFCGINDLSERESTEDEINYEGKQLNLFD